MRQEGRPYEDGTPADRGEGVVQRGVDRVVDVVHGSHAGRPDERAERHQRGNDPADVGGSL